MSFIALSNLTFSDVWFTRGVSTLLQSKVPPLSSSD